MTQSEQLELIERKRMHGLYLSRRCPDLMTLSHELMGLHSWFYRNVAFSALIRGADITGEADQLALFARHPDQLARVIAPSPLVQWLSAARTPDQVLAPADGALAQTLQLAGVVAARAGARP